MKEVLIINLTRMGDLIQTTPTITGLKERFPHVRITLLVNTAFKEICNYLPLVDRYFHLDKRVVLKLLEGNRLIEAYLYIKDTLARINDREYDLVINFTHSGSSAIITSLVNAREVRGLSIDREGYTLKRHPWIRYLFNVIPSRNINPFHLCDMHVKSAGVLPEKKGLHLIVRDDMKAWADGFLRDKGLGRDEYLVAFQLGASAEDKRWPVENFARLADLLTSEMKAVILLTGTQDEKHLSDAFVSSTSARTINMVGRTDLTELSALLERADLLVSNDTGPLHIATAVGTRVIDISLASVHFRETGPYGEGHFVVTAHIPCYPCSFHSDCEYLTCKKTITPEIVYKVCRAILFDEQQPLKEGLGRDVQVYRSFFDRDGLVSYIPLARRSLGLDELFTYIYRYTWQVVLDRAEPPPTEQILGDIHEKLSLYDTAPGLDEELKEYIKAFEKLKVLIDTLLSIMDVMKKEASKDKADFQLIERLWDNIVPIDREVERLACIYPYMRPIVIVLKYEKEAFEGQELREVISEAEEAYRYASWHADTIREILEVLKERFITQSLTHADAMY